MMGTAAAAAEWRWMEDAEEELKHLCDPTVYLVKFLGGCRLSEFVGYSDNTICLWCIGCIYGEVGML